MDDKSKNIKLSSSLFQDSLGLSYGPNSSPALTKMRILFYIFFKDPTEWPKITTVLCDNRYANGATGFTRKATRAVDEILNKNHGIYDVKARLSFNLWPIPTDPATEMKSSRGKIFLLDFAKWKTDDYFFSKSQNQKEEYFEYSFMIITLRFKKISKQLLND